MTKIHLNGRLVDACEARIDPADRGLLLADGLFETLRAYDGRLFCLNAHLARLAAGAAVLGLPAPPLPEIAVAARDTLAANGLADASIRITLTRGAGPRGLLPPTGVTPTLMVAAYPLPSSLPTAMSACLASIRRNEQSPLSRIKSLAYLENILALGEAAAAAGSSSWNQIGSGIRAGGDVGRGACRRAATPQRMRLASSSRPP